MLSILLLLLAASGEYPVIEYRSAESGEYQVIEYQNIEQRYLPAVNSYGEVIDSDIPRPAVRRTYTYRTYTQPARRWTIRRNYR